MSDQSTTEGAAPEVEEKTTEGPPEWLSPITERMEEIAEQSREMQDRIAGLYYTEDEDEDEGEDYEDDDENEEAAVRRFIGSEVDQRVTAHLTKAEASRALEERDALFAELQDEIPALADRKYAAEIVTQAAQELRDHGAAHLLETPFLVQRIEEIHRARGYAEREAAEKAEQKDVVLESGSGASVPQQDKEDWGDRIVAAAERLRPTI